MSGSGEGKLEALNEIILLTVLKTIVIVTGWAVSFAFGYSSK